MSRLKTIGTVLLALMAISAFAASAAMAALPEFSPATANKIKSGKGGAGELTTLAGGISVACKANTVLGEISGEKTGLTDIHFTGCTALGFLTANSLGDESGTILTGSLPFTLCYIKKAIPVELGLFIEKVNTHIEVVGSSLINVTGSIIVAAGPPNKKQKGIFKITATGKTGDQAVTQCEDGKGGVKKASLLASKDEKHEKTESAAITQSAEVEFEKEVEAKG